MYKIFADDELIYDSTIEDYKINKGSITLETNKSGSFAFSIYPDHFYYDKFIKLKTVITVYKSDRIVFRGRILNDTVDYLNNKNITCEGELGFLQDSIISPYALSGTPKDIFTNFINQHNNQVDDFKKFKIGKVEVDDNNNYIVRSNEGYESSLTNLNSSLIESELGGYLVITHGEDGQDEIPTINYLSNFTKVSTQEIEFGVNLKDYTKTTKAEEIATAIIPVGATIGDSDTRLTISSVNNGLDYVYDENAVALRGWIFKVVEWDDVTDPTNLKRKGENYLASAINQNITIELNAIDLHLLNKDIESFNVGDYIRAKSEPHNFDETMLCSRQTLELLAPQNDTVTLGYTHSTFTEINSKTSTTINRISTMQQTVNKVNNQVIIMNDKVSSTDQTTQKLAEIVTTNTNDIELNKTNIANNTVLIETNTTNISNNATEISAIKLSIEDILTRLSALEEV